MDLFGPNMRYLARGGYRFPFGHLPVPGGRVPLDFVGIAVAASPEEDLDDYVLDQLRTLGIRQVRMDWLAGGSAAETKMSFSTGRLLDRLLCDEVRVMLHVVQAPEHAARIQEPAVQAAWRHALEAVVERWGKKLECVEIGATVNRRKWRGYRTLEDVLTAWTVARPVLRAAGLPVAGPNVTDFEPVYNVALLEYMAKQSCLPDIHTDNLFVERAVEPERYDHKVAGHRLAPWLRYNLVKKARLIQRIGADYGVASFQVTHVAWSKRRLARTHCDTDGKQADYLARYLLLAAVSGAIHRVYWGPMIGQREGVIDDGTHVYPEPIPHVTYYGRVNGCVASFRHRPAFAALRTFNQLIPGACYTGPSTAVPAAGLEDHVFEHASQRVRVCWCRDDQTAWLSDALASENRAPDRVLNRDGTPLDSLPDEITESPVYLIWQHEGPQDGGTT